MESCLNFLSVLEGEADIICAVNGGVIHQRVPVFQLELGERVRQGLEALKEGFNVGSLGLHPIQLCHNRLKALLGGFKALGQAVVPFLVPCTCGTTRISDCVFFSTIFLLSCRISDCWSSSNNSLWLFSVV